MFKTGHIMSKEVREKISITMKGKPTHKWTAQSRKKASLSKLGKKYRLGTRQTEETKHKISVNKLKTTPKGENSHRWIKDRT